MKTTYTSAQIESTARQNGMTSETVIAGVFSSTERLVVKMGGFKTASFLMDNETFDYTFEEVYDAASDKTSKRIPKMFTK